jgi:DNA polymerase III epsilon subunit-like protein
MLDTESWVIIDTETTGLRQPIYPVEIAAQRMLGWRPDGAAFRALLDFDVPIEPGAEAIHGYSREYLKANGAKPADAIRLFLAYAAEQPLVAYNMNFDWDRVLVPTLRRLRIRSKLKPGFCALKLARNLAPTLPDFKLQTVIKRFCIAQTQEHRATGDVELVIAFLAEHVAPHLAKNGVHGFDRVTLCSEGQLPVPPLDPRLRRF